MRFLFFSMFVPAYVNLRARVHACMCGYWYPRVREGGLLLYFIFRESVERHPPFGTWTPPNFIAMKYKINYEKYDSGIYLDKSLISI